MKVKEYSGKKVTKAGEALLDTEGMAKDRQKFSDAMDVLSYWRFSHEEALEKAFLLLQNISLKKDKNAIFAKRLKRYMSIIRKLFRFRSMKLRNMQDIGGCRAIFSNQKKLNQTVRELKRQPEFKGKDGKYRVKDYISNPKEDGYRSYHIIGRFPDGTGTTKSIEIQLRTKLQHYWATALEIVDLFTGQALKSNQGDEIWKTFFIHVGKQFSTMDNIHRFESLSPNEKMGAYLKSLNVDRELIYSCEVVQNYYEHLNVFEKFSAFAGSFQVIDEKWVEENQADGYYLIQIDLENHMVHAKSFPPDLSKEAEEEYLKQEKEASAITGMVVALVSTSSVGDIKEAYPNYFADSTQFMEHLDLVAAVNISRPSVPKEKSPLLI